MPSLLLFDLDGTLLQPRDPLHTRAFNEVLAELSGFQGSIDWNGTSGMIDRAILALLLQRTGMTAAETRAVLTRACQQMSRSYERGPFDGSADRVLPGARALLTRLQNNHVPMGLLTGNIGAIAWGRVEQAGLKHFFLAGAFGDEAMRRSTLVRRAVRRCSQAAGHLFAPHDVIIIGDTPRDIEAARQAGVRCLAVATGEYSLRELEAHQPDARLPNLEDTATALRALERVRGAPLSS